MNLAAARRLALALPDSSEAPHYHATSFRAGGKVVGVRIMPAQARPSLARELLARAWRRKAGAQTLSSLDLPEPS